MVTEERRKNPRFPFHSKGEIRIDCFAYRGALIDFSQFGALFESGIQLLGLSHGQKCSLDILQLNDKPLCTIDGNIMHWSGNMIGIQFLAFEQGRLECLLGVGPLNLAPARLFDRKLAALLQAA